MTTDYRALCAELFTAIQLYTGQNPAAAEIPSNELVGRLMDAMAATAAALAQPEPVGPTDEALDELWTEIDGGGAIWAWQLFARAVLSRWGRFAITPIPVSERLPEAGDCGPEGSDEVGCCWLWNPYEGLGRWELQHGDWASDVDGDCTHWLPHWSLPLPEGGAA